MHGQMVSIAGRPTYFPPFVHERFGPRPYWACTFTSLLNGANVGWRGQRPATVSEIRALARASGDVDLRGGSRSSHMVRAMQVRYGKSMAIQRLTPDRVTRRLAGGWALVAAVTYGDLPEHYRRWSPSFKGGHRVVLIGWDSGRTRILDPMANRDTSYTGEWIHWSDFEPAWWAGEQLWFKEGMFLPQPTYRVIESPAVPRLWTAAAGSTLRLYDPKKPGRLASRVTVAAETKGSFDRVIELVPPSWSRLKRTRLLRVSSPRFAGLLLNPRGGGVTTSAPGGDQPPGAGGQPPGAGGQPPGAGGGQAAAVDPDGAAGTPHGADATASVAAAILAVRQAEWDRIRQAVPPDIALPVRPTAG